MYAGRKVDFISHLVYVFDFSAFYAFSLVTACTDDKILSKLFLHFVTRGLLLTLSVKRNVSAFAPPFRKAVVSLSTVSPTFANFEIILSDTDGFRT